ncbi:DUF4199 domain-containing protein [Reichenbachiella versicolor]|uniref:DUF4199 domain-containing protein n=1 Tax=Reichenbachiella versicolor TaxID=1821036 RepID=UPI000D6DE5CB|nr:DUF4199 domain-containing protein [Reichenbachiella versicolor]
MNNELNITGLKHGALAGGIGAIISFILIMIGRELYMGVSGFVGVIVAFSVLIRLGRHERNLHYEGYLSYFGAFVYASILFFISGYIAEVAHISICNYIDPKIKEIMLTEGLKSSEQAFRMLNLEEKEIDKSLDELETSLKMSFSYYSLISNSYILLIRAIFLGAIGAFFIKKSRPDFEE